jgi:coenzyme F420-dependent glucose-6-phosphate dehydrogenase
MPLRLGYKASAEQFGPRELLEYSILAEELGFDSVAISDHFQPWRHTGGHAPAALPWLGALGQRTSTALLGTSVLTPTLRYHPSIIAQAFATLACLSPGRFFLGVGTGEAMNETPATRVEWPGPKERRLRLAEAIELMRRLWSEERVDFEGAYYRTRRATVYDRPDEPVPIYVAAAGPLAAKLAGRTGDGFITTSGKERELYANLLENVREGATAAGRDPAHIENTIEIKVSYDHDLQRARDECRWWAALGLTAEEKSGIEDPIEMERAADAAADRADRRFIVSTDPAEIVEKIRFYTDLGFSHLIFHGPDPDQAGFLRRFAADVVPLLRSELTPRSAAA